MKTNVAIILIGLLGIAVAQPTPSCQWTNPVTGARYDLDTLYNPILDCRTTSPEYLFWINPCDGLVNTSLTTDCDYDCTICRTQFGPSICAGKTSSVVFSPPSINTDGLTATWTSNEITTVIEFVCSDRVIGRPQWISENPNRTYNFVWETEAGCGRLPECTDYYDCQSCLNGTYVHGCSWCLDNQSCQSTNSDECQNIIIHPKYCPAVCSGFSNCTDCLTPAINKFCNWSLESESCISNFDGKNSHDVIDNPQHCVLKH